MADPRMAREIIDQAIAENRAGERLLYGFACVFVACGVVAVLHGVFASSTAETVVGAISSGLFFPAMQSARAIRRENLAIRLLEAPLDRADTAQEAALSIQNAFRDIFSNK